jgi:hypothetical protein
MSGFGAERQKFSMYEQPGGPYRPSGVTQGGNRLKWKKICKRFGAERQK